MKIIMTSSKALLLPSKIIIPIAARKISSIGRRIPHVRADEAKVPAFVGIRDLAQALQFHPNTVFKALGGVRARRKYHIPLKGGSYSFPSLAQVIITYEDAAKLAEKLGRKLSLQETEPSLAQWSPPQNSDESPVIVLLGHFNHGKTTLLDALLGPSSCITASELDGITQEIRTRTIYFNSGTSKFSEITVLDTPGQDIFFRMRSGGASVADMAILVVSSIDGVCEQTGESIGCLDSLNLKAVVALTKIDLIPELHRAKRVSELTQELHEFVSLEDAPVVPVSSTIGIGLDELRSSLSLSLESTCVPTSARNPESNNTYEGAQGICPNVRASVLDCVKSAKMGYRMALLVQEGELKAGSYFVSGIAWGYIRSLYNEIGKSKVTSIHRGRAGYAACKILNEVREIPLGEPFVVMGEKDAQLAAHTRTLEQKLPTFISQGRDIDVLIGNITCNRRVKSAEHLNKRNWEWEPKDSEPANDELAGNEDFPVELNDDDELLCTPVVLKADTGNALAALLDALEESPDIQIVSAGIGAVTERDVQTAHTAKCPIFSFVSKPDHDAIRLLRKLDVELAIETTVQGVLDNIVNFHMRTQLTNGVSN